MGSFFEEILKGGMGDVLGSVLGGGSSSKGKKSGGGLDDIIKDLQKKMGGDTSSNSSTTTTSSSSSRSSKGGLSDVAEELRRQMGGSRSTKKNSSETTATQSEGSTMSDIVREMKKKAGFDVDEPEQTTASTSQEEEVNIPTGGGLGDIFGKLGIDLGNLGGLAESVLKTIGLAGKSI